MNVRSTCHALFVLAALALLFHSGIARAATRTWNNGSANGLWDTTSVNWSGFTWSNAAPDDAIFGATGVGVVTLGSDITANSIRFDANGYTIAQDAGNLYGLTIGTGGITTSPAFSRAATINAKLTGGNDWTASLSSLTIGGSVANDSTGTITANAPNFFTLAKTGGAAATAGNLIIRNNPVRLSGGDQSIGGVVSFDNFGSASFPNSRLQTYGNTLTTRGIANGVLGINNNQAIENGGFNFTSSGTGVIKIVTQNGDNFTYSGFIRDNDGNPNSGGKIVIIKEGLGTQTIAGDASFVTYTGGTTITGGTLRRDLSTTFGQVSLGEVNIGANGTLELYNTNTGVDNVLVTSATHIFGSGNVTKTGGGYIGLWNDTDTIKDFTGLVDVQQGTLGSNGNGWQNSAGLMDLNIATGAFFDMRTQNVKIDGLTGGGTIIKTFSATPLNLSVGNNNEVSANFSGVINETLGGGSGQISLTKAGTGTQILSGANNYTGATLRR